MDRRLHDFLALPSATAVPPRWPTGVSRVGAVDVRLSSLRIADDATAWEAAGFAVAESVAVVGSVTLGLAGAGDRDGAGTGDGIVGWSLTGVPRSATEVDGIALVEPTEPTEPRPHPNGVTHIDHVVVLTPDLRRTTAALARIGLEVRRERDGELSGRPMRQVFYRLGETILEVVGSPDEAGKGPARIWGVTFAVDDIDATAAHLGDAVGRVKDAVQPGRRITTLRGRGLGIGTAVAFISPHVRRAGG